MNKKQLINEIMDLCDENETLKNKLKRYEENNKSQVLVMVAETEKEKAIKELDKKAKDKLFYSMIYDWYMPKVEVKEDSGEFNFLTYEQWFKTIKIEKVINSDYNNLFNYLTYSDIKDYFNEQFKDYFNKLVNDKKMEIVRSKKDE